MLVVVEIEVFDLLLLFVVVVLFVLLLVGGGWRCLHWFFYLCRWLGFVCCDIYFDVVAVDISKTANSLTCN